MQSHSDKRRLYGGLCTRLALQLEKLFKEAAAMKYHIARIILPERLVEELQNYIQAGYIYVPAKAKHRRRWGELSGYREELTKRNKIIRISYHNGMTLEALAEKYHLSLYTIRKIIYQK